MTKNEALIEATAKNDAAMVQKLLKDGADVDYLHTNGYAALHGASISNFIEIAKILIDHKANTNIVSTDHNFTPLHFAALEGHMEIVVLLAENGANLNAKDSFGNGPLFRAGKNSKIGNYLVSKGANPAMENDHGISPKNSPAMAFRYLQEPKSKADDSSISLIAAVQKNDYELVKKVIETTEDVEEKDAKGKTALYLAVEKENEDIVKLLVENGADINTSEKHGYTPLAIASMRGKLNLAKLLVELGAKTDTSLPFDNTLLTLAKNHKDVVAYLKSIL